jgi:adenylate cyclase
MAIQPRAEVPMLVAFVDLTGFARQSLRIADALLAEVIDGYYQLVAVRMAAAGGRTVKFIGDAALIVFGEDAVEAGVAALLDLATAGDRYFESHGWDCRLIVKAHFGTVIAGPFGAPDDRRFDVIGKAVNTAAMLDSTGVTLSVEAFGQLSAEVRQRFEEIRSPATYVRTGDRQRFRRR